MADTPGQAVSGYGQMSPEDTSGEYAVRDFHIKQRLKSIHTNKIVKVLAVYDSNMQPVTKENTGQTGATGFVDVQILVNQRDGQGNIMPHGTIYSVPFSRGQGGGSGIIIDPQVGDMGVMACSDRDISSVVASRDQANPGSYGVMQASDGMYMHSILGGEMNNFLSFKGDGIVIQDMNGNTFTLNADGFVLKDKSGNTYTSSSSGITIKAAAITLDGNVTITGGLTGNTGAPGSEVDLLHHTHPQGNDGHGDTEQDTGPPIGT